MKKGEKGAWISIITYLILSSLKLYIGYSFFSNALIADGYNNLTDIIASVAVLIGLRISQKPPDDDHPYGHFRAETIAALVASFIMITVGIQVLMTGFENMIEGVHTTPDMLTAWVALGCAIVMYGVYVYNSKLADKINNQALRSAAKDNLSDALVSTGAFVGILAAQFGLPWIDSVAAMIVGIIICKTAWEIFRDATHALTDGIDKKMLKKMYSTVAKTEGVQEIKDIKARSHGNNVLIEVCVTVDPNLTIVEGHDICDEIERRLNKRHNILNVSVHLEPSNECIVETLPEKDENN